MNSRYSSHTAYIASRTYFLLRCRCVFCSATTCDSVRPDIRTTDAVRRLAAIQTHAAVSGVPELIFCPVYPFDKLPVRIAVWLVDELPVQPIWPSVLRRFHVGYSQSLSDVDIHICNSTTRLRFSYPWFSRCPADVDIDVPASCAEQCPAVPGCRRAASVHDHDLPGILESEIRFHFGPLPVASVVEYGGASKCCINTSFGQRAACASSRLEPSYLRVHPGNSIDVQQDNDAEYRTARPSHCSGVPAA